MRRTWFRTGVVHPDRRAPQADLGAMRRLRSRHRRARPRDRAADRGGEKPGGGDRPEAGADCRGAAGDGVMGGTAVVPAKAGTHNHGMSLWERVGAPAFAKLLPV